ncbi:putative glycosyltransferase [Paraburkholderia sp. GAS199]|uniref:hypothetical protein n=1 Tax=Paraburkholderia sp. GAS199 TaxID=3035126 RepID=UPI003D1AAD38
MPETNVAFYVHHHGSGHLRRAQAIASHIKGPVTIFSSLVSDRQNNGVSYRALPADHDENTVPARFSHFHYAPLRSSGIRKRMAILSHWFEQHWPCLLVVDVSVEIAAFARLCGVPVVYVRQRGIRSDTAHECAYETASKLLAPYPESWELPDVPKSWKLKTDYAGLISRYGSTLTTERKKFADARKIVTVIVGSGGTRFSEAGLREAARACPDWTWIVLGPIEDSAVVTDAGNITFMGLVENPRGPLLRSDVVVGSAGDSVVSEVAHLRSRFVCIPEERPFGEQEATARLLAKTGQAIVCNAFPAFGEWEGLLHRAMRLTPDRWIDVDQGGAALAATQIQRTASEEFRPRPSGVI